MLPLPRQSAIRLQADHNAAAGGSLVGGISAGLPRTYG
jgi:hypothetical protein